MFSQEIYSTTMGVGYHCLHLHKRELEEGKGLLPRPSAISIVISIQTHADLNSLQSLVPDPAQMEKNNDNNWLPCRLSIS